MYMSPSWAHDLGITYAYWPLSPQPPNTSRYLLLRPRPPIPMMPTQSWSWRIILLCRQIISRISLRHTGMWRDNSVMQSVRLSCSSLKFSQGLDKIYTEYENLSTWSQLQPCLLWMLRILENCTSKIPASVNDCPLPTSIHWHTPNKTLQADNVHNV